MLPGVRSRRAIRRFVSNRALTAANQVDSVLSADGRRPARRQKDVAAGADRQDNMRRKHPGVTDSRDTGSHAVLTRFTRSYGRNTRIGSFVSTGAESG